MHNIKGFKTGVNVSDASFARTRHIVCAQTYVTLSRKYQSTTPPKKLHNICILCAKNSIHTHVELYYNNL